jgi:hypothetical protein
VDLALIPWWAAVLRAVAAMSGWVAGESSSLVVLLKLSGSKIVIASSC